MIITIDGPAGSGKSSAAKKLAEYLHFEFFDTGAMYRAVTWYLLKTKVSLDNDSDIQKHLDDFTFTSEPGDVGEKRYFVNGEEVTDLIRLNDITSKVSEVSANKIVRTHVVKIQRGVGRGGNAVFEGRDMGTVVFPYADIKFYLSAKPAVRAKRRFSELSKKFPEIRYDFESILADIKRRDKIDSSREISPLRRARDSYFIDTSNLSLQEVTEKLIKRVGRYGKRQNIARPYFLQMNPFYSFVLFLSWIYFKIFYRLKVHGLKNFIKGPAIIASNHLSYLDPPAISVSSFEEVHFLARGSLFKSPVFGALIKKLNTHPLSRGASDVKSFKKILALLNQGKKVILFPEGRRSVEGKFAKIEPGISLLVYLSKCSIIPTFIHGTFDIWNKKRKWPKLFGRVDVAFGTPIEFFRLEEPDKKKCMDNITSKLESSFLALQRWFEGGMKGPLP